MPIKALDHIQLAMAAGRKAEARAVDAGLLGFPERPKPTNLAGRGGCWFEGGTIKAYLGVEADFRPARKAHPAFIVEDLASLIAQLNEAGYATRPDEPLPGSTRVLVDDPFGNRIELTEPGTE